MKNSLLIIPFLFFNLLMVAQNTGKYLVAMDSVPFIEDKTVKNEIGFDMYYFLNMFRANYSGEPSSVFSVNYNRELREGLILRSTIGLGYTNLLTSSNSIPPLRTSIYEAVFREGVAWEKKACKRWKVYYGADMEFQYGYNNFQQYFPANTSIGNNLTTTTMVGPGPFLGLVLYVNPRISFSIEANMNFVYSNNTSKLEVPDHPEMNNFNTTKGWTTTYITPQNLFLSIKF